MVFEVGELVLQSILLGAPQLPSKAACERSNDCIATFDPHRGLTLPHPGERTRVSTKPATFLIQIQFKDELGSGQTA